MSPTANRVRELGSSGTSNFTYNLYVQVSLIDPQRSLDYVVPEKFCGIDKSLEVLDKLRLLISYSFASVLCLLKYQAVTRRTN